MTTSYNGLNLIKEFEGLRFESYLCPAMVQTIGYGHTGPDVFKGQTITEQQANELLASDCAKFEKKINDLNLPINQNQFDALVSFSFNVGFGNLLISTLLRKIKVNPLDHSIENEFFRWNKATVNGKLKELPGLTKRRQAESKLYFKAL